MVQHIHLHRTLFDTTTMVMNSYLCTVNLSDPNNTYKSPEHVSETFLNILEGLKINHRKSQGLTIITKIQNALQKHTNNTVENLAEAEKRLFQLENEIKKINEVVKAKHLNSASNNKESHLNDLIMMDVNSSDLSPTNSPVSESTPKRNMRPRGKTTPPKSEKRTNQSPSKKSNQETARETRSSRKRNN